MEVLGIIFLSLTFIGFLSALLAWTQKVEEEWDNEL